MAYVLRTPDLIGPITAIFQCRAQNVSSSSNRFRQIPWIPFDWSNKVGGAIEWTTEGWDGWLPRGLRLSTVLQREGNEVELNSKFRQIFLLHFRSWFFSFLFYPKFDRVCTSAYTRLIGTDVDTFHSSIIDGSLSQSRYIWEIYHKMGLIMAISKIWTGPSKGHRGSTPAS